jgi:lysophospholipase L1-like esterase
VSSDDNRTRKLDRVSLLGALLMIVVLVLCAAALEWLLRAFVFDPSAAYIRTPGWAMKVRTNGLLPHVSEDHVFLVNRLGIRGETRPFGAAPNIAVIGGSTAEDWVLPDGKTWAQQLAARLRHCAPDIWVANLGKGGVNARHHLIQLPEVEKYMPRFDMFVVLLGLNDFLFDLRIHHPFTIPEDWWRRQALMYDHYDEGSLATVALWKRLYRRFVTERKSEGAISDFGYYQRHLRDAHAKVTPEQWVDSMPDISKHLDTYRKTISALKAYADTYGAPIVFVSQPYVWSDNMSAETKAQIYAGFIGADIDSPNTKWYTTEALEKGLSAYNAALLDKCKADHLLCVDAAGKMPREAKYFYDDFHFSTLGAAKLGGIVADEIKPRVAGC